ncbi:MAG: copper resistance CopC/CopD family protein [Gaiellaceae bacterium]
MKRVVVLLALLALAVPAAAAAHATLLRTVPKTGAILARPPRAVRVIFDDSVRVTGGNAAVENGSNSSVLSGKPRANGRTLILPLRAGLPRGDYSVRWSIVSDDGHHEEGVIAFGVGAGSPPPRSVLGASVALTWWGVVLRALAYVGILAGCGAAAFGLLARDALGERLRRPLAQMLFLTLLAAFVGISGMAQPAPSGTRFAHVLDAAAVVAGVGAALAALAPLHRKLLLPAGTCAVLLVAAPTLSGHALDPDQPRAVSIPLDLAHAAAAAVWLGGLLAVVFVLPRTAPRTVERELVVHRFSRVALAAVVAIALSGLGRALTELGAVSQIWSTSYGRVLIVKTGIFLPLLGAGWVNRALLLRAYGRLRRSVSLEAGAVVAILVVVAVLTQLRPGKDAPAGRSAAAVPLQAVGFVTLPPPSAVVDAHELGSLAIAIARTPGRATVTILDPDGAAGNGHSVRIDGAMATACGNGCYRAPASRGPVAVTVDDRSTTFDTPVRAPAARAGLEQLTRAYRSSRTIVFDETLASTPGNGTTTRFTAVAPDRLAYTTRGGPSAVVIGARRWDRPSPRAPWIESPQTPLTVTDPYWANVTNVHLVATGVFTFIDPETPAWFRVTVAGGLPKRVDMTAASHFMVDRYVGFDSSVEISPPPSR